MSSEVIINNPAGAYNPSRDFAKVWPRLLKEAALLTKSPPPGSPAELAQIMTHCKGVKQTEFQEVFCRIAVAAVAATEKRSRNAFAMLRDNGVFDQDPLVLTAVMAAIGQIVTGVIVSAAGDLMFEESVQLFQSATDVKDVWAENIKSDNG